MSIIPGNTWTSLTSLPSINSVLSFNTCALTSTGQYIIACNNYTIYYSSDYGNTFTKTATDISFITAATISDNGYAVVSTYMNNSSNAYIWYSTNYGQTWSQSTNTFSNNLPSISISTNGTYAIVALQNSYLWYSSNGGNSWTVSNPGSISANWSTVTNSSTGQYGLAAVNNGYIYYSTNYGQTWTAGYSITKSWNSISLSDNAGYALASNPYDGIYYLNTLSATSWSGWSQTKPTTPQLSLDVSGSISGGGTYPVSLALSNTNWIFASTFGNASAAWYSQDYSHSWIALTGTGLASTQFCCDITGKNAFFSEYTNNTWNTLLGLRYTTYYNTFANATDTNGNLPTTSAPTNGGLGVACSQDGQYVFYYGGTSPGRLYYAKNGIYTAWYVSTTPTLPSPSGTCVLQCSANGQYVYLLLRATNTSTNIYRSIDYGVTYTSLTNPQSSGNTVVSSVACNNNGNIVYISADLVYIGYLYISTNYGTTWTSIYSSSYLWSSITCNSVGNFVAACVYGGLIYYSFDYGITWSSINNTQLWTCIKMSMNGNRLLAGTNSATSGSGFFNYIVSTNSVNSVSISNSGNVVAVDNNNSYYSNSYGQSNTWITTKTTVPLYNVQLSKNGTYAISIYQNSLNSSPSITTILSSLTIPNPQLYYPMNMGNNNLNTQLTNWASGSPIYDASMNSSYISPINYICGVGSVEFSKNVISGFGTQYTITTPNSPLSVCVSSNELKLIFNSFLTGNGTGNIYYSTRPTPAVGWGQFTVIPGSLTGQQYYRCALSADGTRGITCIYTGYAYFFTWTAVAPANWTQTLDTTVRNYYGLAMTSDGSRIVACTSDGNILFANWNGTNYTAFTRTLNTATPTNWFIGIGISRTGDRIVYSTNSTSGSWYIAYWNGTNYNDGILFRAAAASGRTAYFNSDASVIFLSYATGAGVPCIEYGIYNTNTNSYDTFNNITSVTALDVHALCFNDFGSSGNLYYAGWQQGNPALYLLVINYTIPTSSTQLKYVTLPSFTNDTNGYTVSTWFRSNYNSIYSRIFDFGSGTGSYNVLLAITTNSDSTGYITYSSFGGSSGTTQTSVPLVFYLINDYTWHHIAVTSTYADSTSTTSNVIIYLDGIIVYNTNNQFYYPNVVTRTLNYIGRSNWAADPSYYGNVDDFRWYNSVLTPAQISLIYTNDTRINNFINYQSCTIYRSSFTTNTSSVWGSTTSMGTGVTYYYWNDPAFTSNTFINYPNPVKFTYTYNSSSTQQANLYLMVDNICNSIFVNGTQITGVSTTYNTTITPTTINLNSGNNLFEFYCINLGGPAMIAVYVTTTTGTLLFNTASSTVGWRATNTGFLYKNIPLISFLPNNSNNLNILNVNSTYYIVNNVYDISLNNAFNMIIPYNGFGYNKIGYDITYGFFQPEFYQIYTVVYTTSYGGRIITFTSGTGNIIFFQTCIIELLVVGGGGGGGWDSAGGGGSGGVLYYSSYNITPGSYTVSIGTGGAAVSSAVIGNSGTNTAFGSITAYGGGGGGSAHVTTAAKNGGSGGGAGGIASPTPAGTFGTGTSGQGNNGGAGTSPAGGGGGGPAGAGGTASATSGGNGGGGISYSITGSPVTYGGGGGGGIFNTTTGGNGGGNGGNGGNSTNKNGANATGYGGGGGGGGLNTSSVSGAGSQGVVILRLLSTPTQLYYLNTSNMLYAFSVRLLVPNYTGPVFTLRRSSDNATSDFYADATQSYLTTGANNTGTTFTSWIGANTAYVNKWYDQSGKGNHSTSGTPTISLQNSKYVINFNNTTGTYLNLTTPSKPNTIFCQFYNTNNVFGSIICAGSRDFGQRFGGGNGITIIGDSNNGDWYYSQGDTKIAYNNGISATTVLLNGWNSLVLSTTTPVYPYSFTTIGTDGYTASRGMNGYMTEMIGHNTAMPTDDAMAFYTNRLF
jgi:hypothetical protein